MAPEILINYVYSKAGDVYAFSMIVYELIVGDEPIKDMNMYELLMKISRRCRPEFTHQIPDCYRKLIEACWSEDMYARPTFSEIVEYLGKNESIREDVDVDEFNNYIKYVEGHLPFDVDSTKAFIKIDADYIKLKKPNYLELSPSVEIIDLHKFNKVRKLGYGNYGKVFEVINKETKKAFAAKILIKEIKFLEEIEQINFSREVNIMSKLKHESIIKFYGYSQYNFKGKSKPSYIMELACNQSLRQVLFSERQQHSNKFNNTKKFINIYGIVSVLKYLHSLDILHRDLKTDNIMLDEYLYPKLIDFGFSKELSEKLINVRSNALGTPAYVAPETWINEEHSKASDVYSFSMILYEIITNEKPFSKFINKDQIMIQVSMNHYRPFINRKVPNCYRKLIESCWSENPENRPTFEEILYKLKSDREFMLDDVDINEFLLYTKKIGDDYITFNKIEMKEPQEKYEQSIEKVNLQLGEEKINENTINIFNSVIKEEKLDKDYYIDINDYERHGLIQECDINKIHEVKDKKSNKIYEARISNIDMNQFSIEEMQQICIEMNKISRIRHQSILKINGFSPKNFKNESKPVFITEITSKSTLSKVLEVDRKNIQNPILDATKKLINIYGIASGMKYLHSHDILHRNLRPSNILLDTSNYPKLSDFGMCNHLLIMNSVTFQSITKMQTNSYYQAPEILNSEFHTKESDVYSFCMIVYEILTLEKPMKECKDFSSLYKAVNIKGNRPKCYRELIENCWCQTPRERLTFDEIVDTLRNDPSFITSDINQKEYYEYIEKDDKFTE